MHDMLYLEKLGELYSSLNANEQYGLRFGLLPNRLQEELRKNRISVADLMEFDDIMRNILW